MTQIRGYSAPIFNKSQFKRTKPSGHRRSGMILACLITLCLIVGIGQAHSLDGTIGTPQKGVQVETRLYLNGGDGSGNENGSENGGGNGDGNGGRSGDGTRIASSGSGGGGSRTATLLWTHTFPDAVTTIDMPADGSAVAVGSAGGNITLLNSNGTPFWTSGFGAPVAGIGISAGGSIIAGGAGDQLVMLDSGGQTLWTIEAGNTVLGADISSDGNYSVAGTTAGDVFFVNDRGGLLWRRSLGSPVNAVAASADGSLVAAGTGDGNISLLDSRGDLLWTYDAGSAVQSVSIAAGGTTVAAGTAGSAVLLLDSKGKGTVVWTGDGPINALCLGPRGATIGAGTAGGYTHLLNSAGAGMWTFDRLMGPKGENCTVTGITLSSPADYLAIGSDNRNVYYFAFTAQPPPTMIPGQKTAPTDPADPGSFVAEMQGAPATPQEAPGFCAAAGLGAILAAAVLRRKDR